MTGKNEEGNVVVLLDRPGKTGGPPVEGRLIEPCPAPEFFVSGLGRIEQLAGGNVRLLLYAEQSLAEDAAAAMHRVVVNRIVMPADALPTFIQLLQDAQPKTD